MLRFVWLGLWLGVCLGVWAPRAALAFTVESPVTHGCHEAMSRAALGAAGWPGGLAPPALSEEERRLVRDLPLGEVDDPLTLALLVGARHPDLQGLRETDLWGLAEVHGDPAHQAEHCLRALDHDDVGGDPAALAVCREVLLSQVAAALGPDEALDLEARQMVNVHLTFRTRVEVPLPRFAFQMGQALHGIQDSFAHTLRAADWGRVRAVFNHVDALRRGYDPARDGAPHSAELDDCRDAGMQAAAQAIVASVALLTAVVDAQGGRAGRLARAEAVLARHLEHEPGCTPDNAWCGAARHGCAMAGAHGPGLGGAALPGLGLLLIAGAGAGRGRWRRVARRPPGLGLGLGLCLLLAQGQAQAAGQAQAQGQGQAQTQTAAPRPEVPRLSLYTGLGASFTRGAMAAVVGVRLRLSRRFTLGLDTEYNPWFSLIAPYAHPGLLNIYASVTYTWLDFHGLLLRSGVQAGVAVLLHDLVAADAGTTGVMAGVSVLGCSVPLRPGLYLDLDPAWLVLPLPQLRGVPLLYEQYRVALGLRFGL